MMMSSNRFFLPRWTFSSPLLMFKVNQQHSSSSWAFVSVDRRRSNLVFFLTMTIKFKVRILRCGFLFILFNNFNLITREKERREREREKEQRAQISSSWSDFILIYDFIARRYFLLFFALIIDERHLDIVWKYWIERETCSFACSNDDAPTICTCVHVSSCVIIHLRPLSRYFLQSCCYSQLKNFRSNDYANSTTSDELKSLTLDRK